MYLYIKKIYAIESGDKFSTFDHKYLTANIVISSYSLFDNLVP